MGKGDKKTRRGKIYRGSHGNARPHKADSHVADPSSGKTASKRAVRRPTTRKKAT